MLVALASAPAAQTAPLQFAPAGKQHLPPDLDPSMSVAFGDVDGDGDLDLVVGNYGQNRLYLNNGNGSFTDHSATHLPAILDWTRSIALGDIDGDGFLDLIVGNDGQNRLHLNNGSGVFTDVTATNIPANIDRTGSIALGDVDGDGALDIVVGNLSYGQQNRLLLNNGSGSFTDVTYSNLPANFDSTTSLALGDIDSDGDLDIVVGNISNSAQNRILLNDGRGSFTDVTSSHLPVFLDPTASVALDDLDGDGDLDLFVGNSGQQNRLYLNNGNGSYTDVTGTHFPETVDGTWTVALGDLDGDGDLDLVVGNRNDQQNRLYLNGGSGTFTDFTDTHLPSIFDRTTSVALGDVDGDGDLDLIACTYDQENRLYLNNGNGAFTDVNGTHFPVRFEVTTSVVLGDLDGDGDLDLVVGNGGHQFQQNRLSLNNGSGIFTDRTTSNLSAIRDATGSVALGDVDGDGDLDLVVGNGGRTPIRYQQNRLHLNDGSGTFTDVTATHLPALLDGTLSVALGDVDGDGDLDLVVGNGGSFYGQEQNRLYLNDGRGTFTDVTTTHLPAILGATPSIALGDVDGDGDLDLVFGNTGLYGSQSRLYLNNGSGVFTDVTSSHMPVIFDWNSSVAFGDVDGDGDLDLVFGNTGRLGGQNRLYLNNGNGVFTDVTATHLPVMFEWTSSVTLIDVDDDGDLDLVFGNSLNQQNSLYLNDGSGVFTDITATHLPKDGDLTLSVTVGDIDGDGDVDLVVGNDGQNRLYLNLHRQLDAPYSLRAGFPFTLNAHARNTPVGSTDAAVTYLSLTRVSVPAPPLGTLGISPDALLGFSAIPRTTGVASFAWNVPNLPAFAGIHVFAQALIVSSTSGGRLSNVTSDVLLR